VVNFHDPPIIENDEQHMEVRASVGDVNDLPTLPSAGKPSRPILPTTREELPPLYSVFDDSSGSAMVDILGYPCSGENGVNVPMPETDDCARPRRHLVLNVNEQQQLQHGAILFILQ